MNKVIPMEEMAGLIREQFAAGGGEVRFTPKGTSMLPLLRNNLDTVILKKPEGNLKKYDLPLYQREDGKYVLHRVVKVHKVGIYSMCGDNQVVPESGIRQDQIIGVVTGFVRDGKNHECTDISYKIYCRVWVGIMPIRKLKRRTFGFLRRAKRFLLRRFS